MKICKGNGLASKMRSVADSFVMAAVGAVMLAGCAQIKEADDSVKHAADTVQSEQAKADAGQPVVSRTSASWLLGDTVQVDLQLSPILLRQIAWQPQHKVSLSELAAYITQQVGLPVDVNEVQHIGGENLSNLLSASGSNGATGVSGAQLPLPPASLTTALSNSSGKDKPLPLMTVSYQGDVKGLLDFAANEEGLWWKMDDGAVEFYRTVTKTFYIPAINRKSTGTNSIVAQSGPGSLTSGSTSTTSSSSTGATGNTSVTDSYTVDVWNTIEKTAKTVAGKSGEVDADVSAQPALSSITVTGTPTQVKNVENWVRGLSDKLSQQVLISVSVYSVDLSNEDNYSWNPSVIYNKLSSVYGLSLVAPGAPAVTGSLAPLVISGTAGSGSSKLDGSQLAMNALSTLGHVSETVTQSVVTLNGQPAPMQIANEVTYLAESGSTISANVGSTSTLTPGVVTTGFTATFMPQIVNGRILLSMDMTNSVLNSITTATSDGSSIQTPNVSSTTFQQSVSLTPGAALLLSGIQQDSTQVNRSGVGSAANFLLGGGVDGTHDKKLIAIVITAHVLQ